MISIPQTFRVTLLSGVLGTLILGAIDPETVTAQATSPEAGATYTLQPARIEPYERTPLFANIQGFVRKTRTGPVDGSGEPKAIAEIGDEVSEGEVLAEIDVPELREDLAQKEALVEQAAAELLQATAAITVAAKAVEAAESRTIESEAGVVRARGEYERWNAEHERMRQLADNGSVTGKLVDETLNQLRASEAGRAEAEAHVAAVQADLAEARAKVTMANADEAVARVRVKVAQAALGRVQALLSYTQIRSPFAGVVSQRSIDTGHFVQPGMSSQVPMFLVERIDTLRVAVDIPEREAVQVQKGNAAWIQIPAIGKEELQGMVSRTSWVLDPASRTLRVEIDLPNPERRLRPGMYAKARIELSIAPQTPTGN